VTGSDEWGGDRIHSELVSGHVQCSIKVREVFLEVSTFRDNSL